MRIIRTLLGDIPAQEAGVCYPHEHIIINPGFVTQVQPDIELASVENAVSELKNLKNSGGSLVVDCMPCDAGRDLGKLARISRDSGVHVVGVTGLHRRRYYPEDHWRYQKTSKELAQLFISEIREGVDPGEWNHGDLPAKVRPGAIKLASDSSALDQAEKALFEAGALAHKETGAPIITHCEASMGLEQVRFMESLGVSAKSMILSHTDRHTDRGYHRELLSTGVNLEYDRVFRGSLDSNNSTLELFCEMAPEFGDQVMLSTDGARPSYWRSYGGRPGLDYLLRDFKKLALEKGLSQEQWDKCMIHNPAKVLGFEVG